MPLIRPRGDDLKLLEEDVALLLDRYTERSEQAEKGIRDLKAEICDLKQRLSRPIEAQRQISRDIEDLNMKAEGLVPGLHEPSSAAPAAEQAPPASLKRSAGTAGLADRGQARGKAVIRHHSHDNASPVIRVPSIETMHGRQATTTPPIQAGSARQTESVALSPPPRPCRPPTRVDLLVKDFMNLPNLPNDLKKVPLNRMEIACIMLGAEDEGREVNDKDFAILREFIQWEARQQTACEKSYARMLRNA